MFLYILGITLILWVIYSGVSKPKGYPPGPFRIPIIGYALNVHLRLPYKTWNRLRKQYGEVLGVFMGQQRVVVVNGWEAVKEGLNNDDLNDRPKNMTTRDIFDGKVLGLIFANNEFWKVQRRFSLFHLKNLGFGKKSHEAVMHEELEDVIQEFKATNQKAFSIQTALGVSSVNILWSIIGGERFSRNDKKLQKLVGMLNKTFRAASGSGGIRMILPPLRYVFPNLGGYQTVIDGFIGVKDFVMDCIVEHKNSFDKENKRDFIDVYLAELEHETKEESFTDKQLAATCLDLFAAGAETTSSLLSFAILFLCLHPERQTKIQQELDEVVGKARLPSMADKLRLIETEAFLLETLRFRSPAPNAVHHWSRTDTKLQGYHIPKSTIVTFNLRSVLMEESYWGDPELFRPERFIENGAIKKCERMIPFGKGRRICLGESLARMTSYLTFSALVQNFTFRFPSGERVEDSEGITGFTLGPPPFEVIAVPR